MHGDVIRLVALDFILRLILGGVTGVALVIRIPRMDLDDPASDVPGFGIPGDVIALFEAFCHLRLTRKHKTGSAPDVAIGGLHIAHVRNWCGNHERARVNTTSGISDTQSLAFRRIS
jgi:hypothetical protein